MNLEQAHNAIAKVCKERGLDWNVRWELYDILTKHSVHEFNAGMDSMKRIVS